jgi:hypothetical protein
MEELEEAFWSALSDEGLDQTLSVRQANDLLKALKANMPHVHQGAADNYPCETCGKAKRLGNHR